MTRGVRLRKLSVWFLSLGLVLGVSAPAHAEPEILATLTAEDGPRFTAVSPDGTRLYVSNTQSASVSIFDTATRALIGAVSLPSNPHQLAVSPDGTKLYAGNFAGQVWVVDLTVSPPVRVATVTVGGGVNGIVVSLDGQKVYVANSNSHTISVISASTNTVTATLGPFMAGGTTLRSPEQMVISPNGDYLYVGFTNRSSPTVDRIAGMARIRISDNTAEPIVGATLVLQPAGLAVSSDGRFLYVSDLGGNGVRKYDLTTASGDWLGSAVSTINVASPHYLSLSADDSTLFVAPFSGTGLSIVDTATNTVTSIVTVAQRIGQVTAIPARNARYAFVGSWQGTPLSTDVYVVGTEAVPDTARDASGGVPAVPAIGMALEAQVGSTINGRSVNFTVQRMAAGSSFSLTLQPTGSVVAEGVVGPSGNASGTPRLEGITPGSYQVVLVGTGPDGKNYRLEQSFVVGEDLRLVSISDPVGSVSGGASQQSTDPEKLAYTGVPASQLPTWALVFFGFGLLLVLYSVRARRLVEALAVAVDAPVEKTPWEVLATPIRVPGIDYVPGSQSQTAAQALTLSETLRELDIALSRLLVRNIDRFALPAFRGF